MHIDNLWRYKVDDNWEFWAPRMLNYRSIMRRKLRSVNNGALPDRFRNVFASLDGKRFEISRPSGENNQQAGAYNAYYGYHNVAFQGITSPDGMIMQFSGPHAGSDTDLNMLADSNSLFQIRQSLNNANLNDEEGDLVADKIYNVLAPGLAPLKQNPANEQEVEDNVAGSKVRVPTEWIFGKVCMHFPILTNPYELKINDGMLGCVIRVCILLTNIHSCLYGNNCSKYFSDENNIVLPPKLEEYMSFE